MKNVWRKLYRRELLSDFLILAMLVCLAGGFLTFLMMKVVDERFAGSWDTRIIGITAAVVFILILLAVISFYRLSVSYIRRYKDILDSIPMPVILTDKNTVWMQINKSAREIMNLEQDSELGGLNSKHLINIENNQANLETVRRTVKELDSTRDSIGNALQNIDSVP